MKKIPIALNIDDGAPVTHVFYEHTSLPEKKTVYGSKLLPTVPNSFMRRFCAVAEKHDVCGKLSVVPLPCGKNPYDTEDGKEWLTLLKKHLDGRFSFCPEMLTHHKAYDIENGTFLDVNEMDWSNSQTEESLTKYIELALRTLDSRGVKASGVTSPWSFGSKVLRAYESAISKAFMSVYGIRDAWYFLAIDRGAKPELVLNEDGRRLVAISATCSDFFWETLESPRTDDEFILSIANKYITEDGAHGAIVDTLNAGGHPVILTHWQSLFSNGLETGISALEIVLERIERTLSDRVEFMPFEEKMKLCLGE